jgi:hypothetical protein
MAGKSLQELLAQCDIEDTQGSATATKTASAPTANKQEIDRVIGEMGLGDAASVKTAAENKQENTGGSMGLREYLDNLSGEGQAPAATTDKVAADGGTTATEGQDDGTNGVSEAFGERLGHYFNVCAEEYCEKVAGDLQSEAGKGEQPLAHLQPSGSMTSAIGKPADPALPVNHSASDGEKVHASTGNQSPYGSLKETALKKAILKRTQAAPVGNIVD